MGAHDAGKIYWRHELPPLDVEAMGEQVVEATSRRIPGTLAHRDEQWNQCYEGLMVQARKRILQEVHRMGGTCAHVLDESVESRHDGATGEAWLHGRFNCVVLSPVQPSQEGAAASRINLRFWSRRPPKLEVARFLQSYRLYALAWPV